MNFNLKTRVKTYFIMGLLAILPIMLTIFIVNIGVTLLNSLFGTTFDLFIKRYQFPGIRFLVFIVESILVLAIILFTGLFMTNFIGRMLMDWVEGLIHKLPIINKIYTAAKQLIETVFLKNSGSFREVVLVEYPRKGIYSIGFITNKTNGEIQDLVQDELLNVFIPTTPNPTSGMFIVTPRSETIPLEMSVEDGIKLVISAGIVNPQRDKGQTRTHLPKILRKSNGF